LPETWFTARLRTLENAEFSLEKFKAEKYLMKDEALESTWNILYLSAAVLTNSVWELFQFLSEGVVQ